MEKFSADLFDIHGCDKASVTPIGQGGERAAWVEAKMFPNLLEAIKWIVEDKGKSEHYRVDVHEASGDISVGSDVLSDLIAYVQSKKRA